MKPVKKFVVNNANEVLRYFSTLADMFLNKLKTKINSFFI